MAGIPLQDGSTSEPPYGPRGYILAILFLAYVCSYLDRQLLSMLMPAIKSEMHLSDGALGLLTGPTFAAFYILLGFPVARIADHSSRRAILVVSITLWSMMTAATGLSRSFWMLALCRMGVGVGEAGCSPPAHSLIGELFPARSRGAAMAIYSLGISSGMVLAFALGGWLGDAVGWRGAFLLIGLPGLVVAALLTFTVREPPRALKAIQRQPTLISTWRRLLSIASFRHLLWAGSITNLAYIGALQWAPTFFLRSYGMRATEIGLWLAVTAGVVGGLGTFLGGWLSDRLGRRDRRWYVLIPALGAAMASPTFIILFNLTNGRAALMLYAVPAFGAALGVAPIYAIGQGSARPGERAVTAATLLFAINVLGLGLGPQLVGSLSDALTPSLGPAALGRALSWVMGVGTAVPVLGFLMAARTLRADLEAAAVPV